MGSGQMSLGSHLPTSVIMIARTFEHLLRTRLRSGVLCPNSLDSYNTPPPEVCDIILDLQIKNKETVR